MSPCNNGLLLYSIWCCRDMLADMLTEMETIMNIENPVDFLFRKQELKGLFTSLKTQIKELNISKPPQANDAEDVALAVR